MVKVYAGMLLALSWSIRALTTGTGNVLTSLRIAATASTWNKSPLHRSPLLLLLYAVQRIINSPFLYTPQTTFNHSKMKYTTVCAAFFAAVAAASDVKQLKTDNFKSFIEENDLVLAECKYQLHIPIP